MITIKDVAKAAEVSTSTASRALNNNPAISQKTIDHVKKVADNLGYQPNYNAKNLTNGKTNTVGVIFPAGEQELANNPFYFEILSGINNSLIIRDWTLSVAISNNQENLLRNVKSMIDKSKIDKYIVLYSRTNDSVLSLLRKQNKEFIIIGQPVDDSDRYVDSNNYEAGFDATEFLIKKYRPKKLVFVQSKDDWLFEKQRYQGFKESAENHNLVELCIKTNDLGNSDLLSEISNYDAVVTVDDNYAFKIYEKFIQNNMDPKIVSFNNIFSKLLPNDSFDSVELYPRKMGEAAVRLLFDSTFKTEQIMHSI